MMQAGVTVIAITHDDRYLDETDLLGVEFVWTKGVLS